MQSSKWTKTSITSMVWEAFGSPNDLWFSNKAIQTNSIFTMVNGDGKLTILVFVDNLTATENNVEKCIWFNQYMKSQFQVKEFKCFTLFSWNTTDTNERRYLLSPI